MTHGGMFSYRVQRLIKCWINDTVNKKINCLGADILKLNIVSLPIDVMTFKINVNKIIWF
jgi:hypothetical protein